MIPSWIGRSRRVGRCVITEENANVVGQTQTRRTESVGGDVRLAEVAGASLLRQIESPARRGGIRRSCRGHL